MQIIGKVFFDYDRFLYPENRHQASPVNCRPRAVRNPAHSPCRERNPAWDMVDKGAIVQKPRDLNTFFIPSICADKLSRVFGPFFQEQ